LLEALYGFLCLTAALDHLFRRSIRPQTSSGIRSFSS
jgi:hypothetical protein